jgi:hypothetical protein
MGDAYLAAGGLEGSTARRRVVGMRPLLWMRLVPPAMDTPTWIPLVGMPLLEIPLLGMPLLEIPLLGMPLLEIPLLGIPLVFILAVSLAGACMGSASSAPVTQSPCCAACDVVKLCMPA